MAMDCTTLTLVDAAPSQSALFIGESQDCGVEATIFYEGGYSAAPIAQNEFSSKEAIANQTQGQAEQSNSASLLAKNSVLGVEIKAVHEGTGCAAPPAQIEKSSTSAIADQKIEPSRPSAELLTENSVSGVEIKAVDEGENSAPPVPQTEKWSHEAIVARSNMRPERM